MIAAALLSLVAALAPGKMPQLRYFGGRVLAKVHVIPVLWGDHVDTTTQQQIGGFYAAAVNSLGWLDAEYGSGFKAGLSIGNGTADAPVIIHPPASMLPPLSAPLLEDNIVAELRTHFGRELPSPPGDPQNTVYMMHFPNGLQIVTSDGTVSCQVGGFCALHDTFAPLSGTSSNLLVAMILDHGPNSGCDRGCGISSDPFQNVTNSASHELVETVTDPDVGLSGSFSDGLTTWYDPLSADAEFEHGEIADICANGGPDGASLDSTYVVQKEWSNAWNACIGTPDDAFRIVDPNSTTVPAVLSVKIANVGAAAHLAVASSARAGPRPVATGTNVHFKVPIPPANVTVTSADATIGTQAPDLIVTASQGVSLPATMIVHADSDPGPLTNQPQTTAYALVKLSADDFTISGPQNTPVAIGQQVSVQIQTNPAPGSGQADLTLSVTGPSGVTGSLDHASITSGGTAMATVGVDAGVPSGATPVTVSATTGLVSHSVPLLFLVDGDDFSVSLDKTKDSVVKGGTVTVQVKTLTTHGNPQTLTLSAQAPAGIGATFNPPQITSGQTSTLTLTTAGARAYGPQAVTIAAQGPHASQQASFSLGVGQSQGCSSAGEAPALAALALLILRRRR